MSKHARSLRSHSSDSTPRIASRWLGYGAPALVVVAAFLFLGGMTGLSGVFASFGEYAPQGQEQTLAAADEVKTPNPVGVVLSHWEYTSHCTAGNAGSGGCPANCGSGGCANVPACCTGVDQADGSNGSCGTSGNAVCQGCCTGNGTGNTF